MDGFKKLIMKGNLIELATAFIMGTAFAAVVTATTNVIMSIILKVSGGKEPNFDAWQPGGLPIGAFITALISFLLMAAIVYFLIVAPYQKAKELWFPAEESDETPADVAVLEEIRDLLKAQRGWGCPRARAQGPERPPPWCGGTWARSHASLADSVRGARSSRSSPVVSGRTSPKISASRRRRCHSLASDGSPAPAAGGV